MITRLSGFETVDRTGEVRFIAPDGGPTIRCNNRRKDGTRKVALLIRRYGASDRQAVAVRVRELLDGRVKAVPVAPGAGFDETLHELDQALVAHEDHVRIELLEVVRNLTPSGFERLIKRVLEAVGFENAVVTGRSNDGGIDVRATLRVHSLTSVPTVVQAKRWAHNVSGAVVRELRGALVVGEQGIVITTSGFTKAAQAEATVSGKTPVALVDGEALVQLMIEQSIGVRSRPVSFNRIEPEDLLDAEAE